MNTHHFIAIAALIGMATVTSAAQLPTDDVVNMALAKARAAWRADPSLVIEFRWDALNSCNLRTSPEVATLQGIDTQTTIHFDDDSQPDKLEHAFTYVIRLNSSCDWNRLGLDAVMVHEVGHVMLGPDHSCDPHSVMFWKVMPGQIIQPEDWDKLRPVQS